jgi:hypothetical protein
MRSGTIASETLDSAISAHQRFLDNVLRIGGIPRRSYRDLEQKGTVLPGSRLEIDVFCSNSYRLHPPVSVLMTALRIRTFEIISLPFGF